ncbi:MAG: hypothetical protein Q8O34_17630 [Rhodocyclaceae bacterium]|nr:hypothetical protein [Rhodocyclaceae bacterium]
MCHALLLDPKFFQLLLRIDEELAAEVHAGRCECGGVLHRANYPRKPRACLKEVRSDFASRFSFCCADCRKRKTSTSVRFLGRRVYLALAVVLCSARHAGQNTAATRVASDLAVPVRTLRRWRQWWTELLPRTPLWQACCARFMPPVASDLFPGGLLERFAGDAAERLMRLLVFLSPLTATTVTVPEGR